MENNEIELDDDFETPRGSHSPISQSSGDCERPECDNDECAVQSNGNDIVHSSIDIESISIELGPNDPSTTVSTCSDDHKTNRNILSVQKEEAFDDWLSAKKFVYTNPLRVRQQNKQNIFSSFFFDFRLEYPIK